MFLNNVISKNGDAHWSADLSVCGLLFMTVTKKLSLHRQLGIIKNKIIIEVISNTPLEVICCTLENNRGKLEDCLRKYDRCVFNIIN